jgi:hypothetical protein
MTTANPKPAATQRKSIKLLGGIIDFYLKARQPATRADESTRATATGAARRVERSQLARTTS